MRTRADARAPRGSAEALRGIRAVYRAVLRSHLVALTDDEIAALLTATHALETLIDALQQGDTTE